MHPCLLSVLIILRLKNQALYQGFVKGDRRGSEVMDYIDKLVFDAELDHNLHSLLNQIEVDLYFTYLEQDFTTRQKVLVGQLSLIEAGEPLTHPEYLSERTKKSEQERKKELLQIMQSRARHHYRRGVVTRDTLQYLSGLIELVEIPQ